MWCFIIVAVAALLYMPHLPDFTQPADSNVMTRAKANRVENYVWLEMLIVGMFMVGGAITIRSAVARMPKHHKQGEHLDAPQKDAKPAAEEPLLMLTDEGGKFVV
jgi:hypothetical protein